MKSVTYSAFPQSTAGHEGSRARKNKFFRSYRSNNHICFCFSTIFFAISLLSCFCSFHFFVMFQLHFTHFVLLRLLCLLCQTLAPISSLFCCLLGLYKAVNLLQFGYTNFVFGLLLRIVHFIYASSFISTM